MCAVWFFPRAHTFPSSFFSPPNFCCSSITVSRVGPTSLFVYTCTRGTSFFFFFWRREARTHRTRFFCGLAARLFWGARPELDDVVPHVAARLRDWQGLRRRRRRRRRREGCHVSVWGVSRRQWHAVGFFVSVFRAIKCGRLSQIVMMMCAERPTRERTRGFFPSLSEPPSARITTTLRFLI